MYWISLLSYWWIWVIASHFIISSSDENVLEIVNIQRNFDETRLSSLSTQILLKVLQREEEGHLWVMTRCSNKLGLLWVIIAWDNVSTFIHLPGIFQFTDILFHYSDVTMGAIASHDCLHNRLFRRRSKKASKLRVTGLCTGNSPVTGEFLAQMASNAENVFIWWRHHASRD